MQEQLIYSHSFVEVPLYVKTYDIDVAGHVNNIVYVRWLEDMRNEYFSKICPVKMMLQKNYYPVIVSSELKYKRQVKLFDAPVGKMYCSGNSHGIYNLHAEIIVNNKIVFTALQKCALLNLNNNSIYKGKIYDLIKEL